jgi:hypothetical protein
LTMSALLVEVFGFSEGVAEEFVVVRGKTKLLAREGYGLGYPKG